MRVGCEHHRRAGFGGRARDPLAGTHPRPPAHLVDRRAVGRAKDQLVSALVVEVDEARVRDERFGDVRRHERQHPLQVERRVDRLDRLGQQPQVPFTRVHPAERVRSPPMSTVQWLLTLHITAAFLLLGGSVARRDPNGLALRAEKPSEIALFLGLIRIALPLITPASLGDARASASGSWHRRASGSARLDRALPGSLGASRTRGRHRRRASKSRRGRSPSASPARATHRAPSSGRGPRPEGARALLRLAGARDARHPRADDLEARTVIAFSRPFWPLFLHVLGAMPLLA